MGGPHMRFTIVVSQSDLREFAYTTCISQLRLSYAPLKKDSPPTSPNLSGLQKERFVSCSSCSPFPRYLVTYTESAVPIWQILISLQRERRRNGTIWWYKKSLDVVDISFFLTFYWFYSQSRSPFHSQIQLGKNGRIKWSCSGAGGSNPQGTLMQSATLLGLC